MGIKSTPDGRYTVTVEHCGYETPRYVFRFCGGFRSAHETKREAETAAWDFHGGRMRDIRLGVPSRRMTA